MKAYIRIVGLLVAQLEATATNDTRVTYQPAGGCDTSAITTNVMMDFKKCEADEDEYAMRELYRRDSLAGIRELQEWLATVLRRQIVVRLPARLVIQYCWRPGRWKSLT